MKNHHRFQEPEDRRLPGKWEQATNKQQKRLVKDYDKWGVAVRKQLNAAIKRGATDAELQLIIDRAVPGLEETILATCNKGTEQAARISAGERATNPRILARIEKGIEQNKTLVKGALMPRLAESLKKKIAGDMGKQAVKAAFDTSKGLPASYAGGYWVMIFETQRDLGFERERERRTQGLKPEPIRWVLDPAAEHCLGGGGYYGCMELAGEYESWDALPTVPAGLTQCRGGCRCHLEVLRDGQWQRGVY